MHIGQLPERAVDGLLDTAGITLPQAVRAGGRYVSLVPGSLPTDGLAAGVETSMSYVNEDGSRLAELVRLVDAARLSFRTAAIYPLTDVTAAHTHPHSAARSGKTALIAD